ncbi:hypothetical protein LTR27_001614 [Elasticomyces elasticus]|nr:hypothetical protein LTR27_001614 [Elasticomyces elasticus]
MPPKSAQEKMAAAREAMRAAKASGTASPAISANSVPIKREGSSPSTAPRKLVKPAPTPESIKIAALNEEIVTAKEELATVKKRLRTAQVVVPKIVKAVKEMEDEEVNIIEAVQGSGKDTWMEGDPAVHFDWRDYGEQVKRSYGAKPDASKPEGAQ